MSDPSPDPTIVNRLSQPVELYLVNGLTVLPPRGQLTVAESELECPHIRALFDARIIGRLETAPSAPEPEATKEASEQASNAPDEKSGAGERNGKRGNQ